MTLPPFENLGELYHQGNGGEVGRNDSVAERWQRMLELRQKVGERILGEAYHVASALRGRHIDPELEIVDNHMQSRIRRKGVLRKYAASHASELRGQYFGWRIVQAEWAMHRYVGVSPNSSSNGTAMPMVEPGHIACRGIALLTDGRLLPYDTSDESEMAIPDWQVDDAWRGDSLGLAIVQEDQVSEDGYYDDVWPMHKDMRQENVRYPLMPTWALTTPSPETHVYGRGIRDGLGALARCHGITIPPDLEGVRFIGEPLAHTLDGALPHKIAWGRK